MKCENCLKYFWKDRRWRPYCSWVCAQASMTAEAILKELGSYKPQEPKKEA
jgi:hypothetical protein